METRYIIGIDPGTSNSNGALVVTKHSPKGIEVIRVMKWYEKMNWVNRFRYKWLVLCLYFRHFRKVKILVETNSQHQVDRYFVGIKLFCNIFKQ